MGATRQQQMRPTAKAPAPNAVKVSAPKHGSPVRPQNAARDPYQPLVRPAAQYETPVRQEYAARPQKRVQDVIQRFERK
jgi:hypothetical protein